MNNLQVVRSLLVRHGYARTRDRVVVVVVFSH